MHEIFNLYLHQHWTTLGPNVFMASRSAAGNDEGRWWANGNVAKSWVANEEDQAPKAPTSDTAANGRLIKIKYEALLMVSQGERTTSLAHLAKSIEL